MTGITRVPVVFVKAYLVDIPDGSGDWGGQPLLADDTRLVRIPPPVADPLGVLLRAVAVSAAIGSALMLQRSHRRSA